MEINISFRETDLSMKNIIYSFLIVLTLLSCGAKHQKTETLKVFGNCGMCKQTIENSLKVDGVAEAKWDKKTKILTVTYDSLLTDKSTIATYVASSGYDNELVKAKDEVYNKLHSCCQYERAK